MAGDPRLALPELDVARVRRWCAARVPEHARHQVRVECEIAPRHLTILERRAPWHEDLGPEWTTLPIARLRYTAADKSWTLYWRDRNLRFHNYDPLAHHQVLSQPTGIGVDRPRRTPEIHPHPQPLDRPLVPAQHRPLLLQHHRGAQTISQVRGHTEAT